MSLSELAGVFPSLARMGTATSRRCRTSATARTGPCASCSSVLASTRPLVLVLDDLHWADPASVELSGRCCAARPTPPCCWRWPCGRGRCPSGCARRSSAPQRAGALTRLELGAPHRAEAARAPRRRHRRRRRRRALRGERRQPVLPPAARARRGRGPATAGRRRRGARRTSACRPRSPPRWREELALLPTTRAACSRARPSPATRSSPSCAAAAGVDDDAAHRRARRAARASIWCAPPTSRAVSASGIHSCAAPSTSPTPGGWRLGAHERAPTRSPRAARAPAARAHHVEQSARAGDLAAVALLQEAGEAAARRAPDERSALVRRGPAPAPGRCVRAAARRAAARQAAALTATGSFRDSHAALLAGLRSLTAGCRGELRLKVITALAASSTCSAVTRARTRAC